MGAVQSGVNVPAATIASAGYATDEANLGVYTFNGVAIGAAGANRTVYAIAQMDRNGATTGSMTCNGVAMTMIAEAKDAFSQSLIQIYALNVAAGTTANFILTTTFACNRAAVWTFAAYNVITPGAAYETYIGTGANPQALASVDVQSGGFALFGCSIQSGTGTPINWTNATGQGTNLEGTAGTYLGAAIISGAVSGVTVTATPNSAGRCCTVGVSIR